MTLAVLLCAASCKAESSVSTTFTQLPFCTGRTPAKASGFYPQEALPQGACKDEPKCQMQVERPCACSAIGPVDLWTCSCTNGTWACAIDQQGGTCDCAG
jgi:hypothetical protein